MTIQTKEHRNHTLLQFYARQIMEDDRYPLLVETVDRELFEQWRGEVDPAKRELIHNEYLGFKLFLSKIKALAYTRGGKGT